MGLIGVGVLVLLLTGASSAAFLYLANQDSIKALEGYQADRSQLTADVQAALKSGYTADDLQSITTQVAPIDSARPPFWIGSRTGFYRTETVKVAQLDSDLKSSEQELLQQAESGAAKQVTAAQNQIAHDQQIEVPDAAVAPLSQRMTQLAQTQGAAHTISDWRGLLAQATTLLNDATTTAASQEQENSTIQQAADVLVQQLGGNIDAIRKAGQGALASGRNDATVAAYESKPGRFSAINQLMDVYNRMEHYAATRLGSADVNQVAFGAAAVQRYGGQVHQLLMQGLGPKHVIVSFQAQHVWAYQDANLVMNSAVTTGIRGVTQYGTDFGPMKVVSRSHPFKMHSPWPKGSPFWYPDTVVQWTAFFTYSGEALHDAYWESDSELGPGSQYDAGTRSHGCIHLPYNLAEWMYQWSQVGTPVDVYPGNGQPVAEQLSEMTTDNNGNPLNPA